MLVMLWGYFDESGEHDRSTGYLSRLAIGGFMAPYEEWQRAIPKWQQALSDEGVKLFHMADFEAHKGEFESWPDNRHRRFLNKLLEVIDDAKVGLIGVSWPASQPRRKALPPTYATCFGQVVNSCANTAFLEYQSMGTNLIFAEHPEFKAKRIKELYEGMKGEARFLQSCTISTPDYCVPLQIADLAAYEVCHAHDRGQKDRYPWTRLLNKYRGDFPGLCIRIIPASGA
jgi:hypothetical protein